MRILTTSFILLASCSSRQVMYYESAGDAQELLISKFGEASVTNSLNYYIENNPWSIGDEYAISIKADAVLLIISKRTGESQFSSTHHLALFDKCSTLSDSVRALRSKLDFYEDHPDVEKAETSIALDPPSLTLREFGNEANHVMRERRRLDQGQLAKLGWEIVTKASECTKNS